MGEDVERRDPSCTVGGWGHNPVRLLRKTAWRLLKELKTERPGGPATPLLGRSLKELNPLLTAPSSL